jgi:hypothetical protein
MCRTHILRISVSKLDSFRGRNGEFERDLADVFGDGRKALVG